MVHWDETFPHIHLSGLPSVQNVYEQDVYSQHKDPRRRKLLHEKGEVRISFSTERFNPEFFQTFHPRMIEEMESIAREQGKEIDASGLLNGATKEKSFDVQSMSHEERENSVYETNKAKYLEKNNKELEKENQKLASQNLELKEENQRLASQNLELEYMNVQLEDKVETLEAKVNYWQKALQRIKALILKELEKFKNSAFDILENFKQAIILSKPEKLEVLEIEAKSELEVGIEKSIKAVTDVIPDFSVADEIETHFAKTFNRYDKNGSDKQKVGYAKKQILSNLPPEAECFEKEEVLLRAIDDWFDEEKYLKKLKAFRTLEEAQTYMEPRNRAIRAIEQAMKDAPAIIESLAETQNKIDR